MIYYNKVQRRNPQDPEGARKWYVTLKSRLQVSERELAEEIADEVTLNPKEAEMAFYQLFKVAVRALTDGKTVKLATWARFTSPCRPKGRTPARMSPPSW